MKKLSLLLLMITLTMGVSLIAGPIVTTTTDAIALTNEIVGAGITIVGTPTLTGVSNQSGIFTTGLGTIGFGSGIILSSGIVSGIAGPNGTPTETLGVGAAPGADLSYDLGTPGDAALSTLSGETTYDANVLGFNFQFGDGTMGGDLFFNYVFASEEYLDYVNSIYNDVFGFFVDDVNIALLPDTLPVAVNNVNPLKNSSYYRNNVPNTNFYPNEMLDIKYDGLTVVLQAKMLGLGPGVHTMKFAVADASDHVLDAAVFIQAGSFSPTPTPIGTPEPSTWLLMGSGLAALAAGLRRGTGR